MSLKRHAEDAFQDMKQEEKNAKSQKLAQDVAQIMIDWSLAISGKEACGGVQVVEEEEVEAKEKVEEEEKVGAQEVEAKSVEEPAKENQGENKVQKDGETVLSLLKTILQTKGSKKKMLAMLKNLFATVTKHCSSEQVQLIAEDMRAVLMEESEVCLTVMKGPNDEEFVLASEIYRNNTPKKMDQLLAKMGLSDTITMTKGLKPDTKAGKKSKIKAIFVPKSAVDTLVRSHRDLWPKGWGFNPKIVWVQGGTIGPRLI